MEHPTNTVEVQVDGAGTFRFAAVLTIREQIRTRPLAEAIYGAPIPADANNIQADMAFVLAALQIACKQAPAGWDWEQLSDAMLLRRVWEAYNAQAAQFRAPVETDPAAASE